MPVLELYQAAVFHHLQYVRQMRFGLTGLVGQFLYRVRVRLCDQSQKRSVVWGQKPAEALKRREPDSWLATPRLVPAFRNGNRPVPILF